MRHWSRKSQQTAAVKKWALPSSRSEGPVHAKIRPDYWKSTSAQQKLKDRGLEQSMSRKGNCLDNAVMENFFGLLKVEFFYRKKFESVDAFSRGLHEYIHYYNHDRIKEKLKGLSPVMYRIQSLIEPT